MADDTIVTDDIKDDDIEETEVTTDEEPEDTTEPDPEDDKDIVVPVRDTALQHIIGRQKRQIKKLTEKKDDDDEEVDEGDDDLSQEAKSAVQQEIDAGLEPFRKTAIETETKQMLNDLFQAEPDAKRYEKRIRKYMDYEKNGVKPFAFVPPAVIYHDLAFNDAASVGATEGREADEKARITSTRGRGRKLLPSKKTASGLPSIETMEAMSDDDFNKITQPKG